MGLLRVLVVTSRRVGMFHWVHNKKSKKMAGDDPAAVLRAADRFLSWTWVATDHLNETDAARLAKETAVNGEVAGDALRQELAMDYTMRSFIAIRNSCSGRASAGESGHGGGSTAFYADAAAAVPSDQRRRLPLAEQDALVARTMEQLVGRVAAGDTEQQIQFNMIGVRIDAGDQGLAPFNIPEKRQCAWGKVIAGPLFQLSATSLAPEANLALLVEATQLINSIYQESYPGKQLATDDFFPIFLYCLTHSRASEPVFLTALLKSFAEDKLLGSEGYVLTTFEAAVDFLLTYDVADG